MNIKSIEIVLVLIIIIYFRYVNHKNYIYSYTIAKVDIDGFLSTHFW